MNSIQIPTNCPSCNSIIIWEGPFLYCKNNECPAKYFGDIEKWVEITKMDDVGPAFIEDMLNCGLVKDSADLYSLTPQKILESGLAGYKAKSANKLCSIIQSKRELALPIFLAALNIPEVSEATFTSLVESGHTLESLMGANVSDLIKVRGIGEITAEVIVEGLKSKKDLIEKLLTVVSLEKKKEGKLSGMSFCFTGEISIKRGHAQQLVRDAGGIVKSSVSKGLSFLVIAKSDSQSGKAQKARSYGTQLLNEDEFFSLVGFDPIADLLKD